MRRRLILHEQDLLAEGFLLPTLSRSILFICFWTDLVRVLATNVIRLRSQAIRVYKYTKFKGLDYREINYIIAKDQKSDLHST